MFDAKKIINSYAFFDIIGIKEALIDGKAIGLLDRIWKLTDAWAFNSDRKRGKLLNQKYISNMIPYVTTISDSIIIKTKEEFEIEEFYNLVDAYRTLLKTNEIQFYTIINRDWEVYPPGFPVMGGTMGNYLNITGVGAAWGNIYLGDSEIRKNKREWIDKYFYFVIDDKSGKNLIQKYQQKARHDFIGVNNEPRTIIAIE